MDINHRSQSILEAFTSAVQGTSTATSQLDSNTALWSHAAISSSDTSALSLPACQTRMRSFSACEPGRAGLVQAAVNAGWQLTPDGQHLACSACGAQAAFPPAAGTGPHADLPAHAGACMWTRLSAGAGMPVLRPTPGPALLASLRARAAPLAAQALPPCAAMLDTPATVPAAFAMWLLQRAQAVLGHAQAVPHLLCGWQAGADGLITCACCGATPREPEAPRVSELELRVAAAAEAAERAMQGDTAEVRQPTPRADDSSGAAVQATCGHRPWCPWQRPVSMCDTLHQYAQQVHAGGAASPGLSHRVHALLHEYSNVLVAPKSQWPAWFAVALAVACSVDKL